MIGRRAISTLFLHVLRNESCTRCILRESSQNVCIMGKGNVTSPIVLIGEAPGEAEAIHGKPFCGASGKWMHKQLSELGMEGMVYITNSCRCRPPNNRKPTSLEVDACRMYLMSELEIIQPRVIVCLGRTAAEAMRIRAHPRHVLRYVNERHIVTTWHPAYCLRMGTSGHIAKQFIAALATARDFARKKS